MRRLPLLLIPLALFAAACGSDDPTTADAGSESSSDAGDHNGHGGDTEAAANARTIEVNATSFEFDPPKIEAEVGEDLAIELTAEDVEHDFVIDELDAHVSAEAGETASGGFNVGDEPGSFTYYCSVAGHRKAGMEGELVVS